jgi:hypothetical protein
MTNQNIASNFFSFLKIFNFVYVFEMKIYYQKIYLYNTIIYKKCVQRVNIQYKVLTLYETKSGKKLWPNVSLLFESSKYHYNFKLTSQKDLYRNFYIFKQFNSFVAPPINYLVSGWEDSLFYINNIFLLYFI